MSKIAFQGELGANSHMACRMVYPDMDPLPCDTFDDAFEAVVTGQADLGMIAIENNQAGRVADIHTLLPKSGVFIIGEHFQPIAHNLLAAPGTSFDHITEVRSHVMALAQCRASLKSWGVKPVVSADTAGAARALSADPQPHVGVIASKLAAEIYGLDVLQEHVEDEHHNTTRFVVVSKQDVRASVDQPCMTTIVFHNKSIPSALYKCLGGFATNAINVTKLESYVYGPKFASAQFYMDFEGHPDDPAVSRALQEVEHFAFEIRVIGVYPQAPFRLGE